MNKLPVFELVIDESITDDKEVTFVALVDRPAIKKNFLSFADDSYNDYPEAAVENAKTALRWVEEHGWGDCGEATGKARANQLANRESLTRDTIARMSAFVRHKGNSDKPLGDGCGRLMWLAWGGDEGIAWAERKLKQIDKQNKFQFEIQSEDERIVTGPLMLADTLIYRNQDGQEYNVYFSKDTIKKIVQKYFQKNYINNVNLMHDGNNVVDGVYMFESWIVDNERGVKPLKGFEDVPDGSWFASYKVENDKVWSMIKDGTFKGFSVEGAFDYKQLSKEEIQMREIIAILQDISLC